MNANYHIGLIPDGNRRWATSQGLTPKKGHEAGAKKMKTVLEWAIQDSDVKELTVYGLSEENYKRSNTELTWLYDIYNKKFKELMDNPALRDNKVKVNVISTNNNPIPRSLKGAIKDVMSETKLYGNKVLNILIGYTGQSEILSAVSSPINRVKNLFFGLNESDIQRSLGVKTPCDLIIRTGNEEKPREGKSGFLLWQSAYSEQYHINKYFPDITINDLNSAKDYLLVQRRRRGL